jgi:type I restriction enzyme R subunit
VLEAKAIYEHPGDGLQQAKEYAQILGLKFAYAFNGRGIVEHDFLTGREVDLDAFHSPEGLWGRFRRFVPLLYAPCALICMSRQKCDLELSTKTRKRL